MRFYIEINRVESVPSSDVSAIATLFHGPKHPPSLIVTPSAVSPTEPSISSHVFELLSHLNFSLY